MPGFKEYSDICMPKSIAQTKYISNLAGETELIYSHSVPRTEDKPLKVTTDERKCAPGIRLVDLAE